MDRAAVLGDGLAFFCGYFFQGEVSSFDVDVGLGKVEELGGADLVKDTDGADALECGEDAGAVGLVVDWAGGSFEFADGGIAIEADEEEVTLFSGGFQVGDVSGVEDIEATVGGYDLLPGAAGLLAPGFEVIGGEDLMGCVQASSCSCRAFWASAMTRASISLGISS
ncbi:MAG: hypothetical protein RI897_2483 [Verrucomicrobiota bacterium]